MTVPLAPGAGKKCHKQADYDSDVGQGRYNCPVGLDRRLGPTAVP